MSLFATPNTSGNTKKVANINVDDVSTNQEAIPVPYIAGVQRIALEWINEPYNPKAVAVQSGGSKFTSSQTTGYKYYGDLAGLICLGPLDVIYMIIRDNNVAWPTVPNTPAAYTLGGMWRTTNDYDTIAFPGADACRIYWGTQTQPVDSLILTPRGVPTGGVITSDPTTWPTNPAVGGQQTFDGLASGDANPLSGHYDVHPPYRGMAYIVFKQLHFGEGRNTAPTIEVVVGRATSWFGNTKTTLDLAGVQPFGPLYESLTNGQWGGEFTDADLDEASFNAGAAALSTFVISPLITQSGKHRDFLQQLVGYFDGWLRRNGTIIQAGYFAHGNLGTAFPHVASDDLTAEPDVKSTGWGGTFNFFSVIYNNLRRYFKQDVERYTDEANREAVDETRTVEAQMPWIIDSDIAQQYAVEWGQLQALAVHSGKISVKRERVAALGINVGGRFYLDSASLGFSMLMRVLELEYPKDSDGTVNITVESERGLWPAIYYPPSAQKDPEFNFGPQPIAHYRALELPLGLRDNNAVTEIAILALRPNVQCVAFRVWESPDNITYRKITAENQFSAFGKLSVDYIAGTSNPDTSTGARIYLYGPDLDTVLTQSDSARDDGTLLLLIDNEIMSVGAVTALGSGLFSIMVLRAMYGTTQALHAAGAECWFFFRSAITPNKSSDFLPGATVWFQLQSHTQTLDDDLSEDTPFSYALSNPQQYSTPSLSPGTQSFYSSLNAYMVADAGLVIRFTLDGSQVDWVDDEWPKTSGVYNPYQTFTHSCILSVCGFLPNGQRATQTAIAVYTLVASGSAGAQTCAVVTFNFSGTQNQTAGNLTMLCATPAHTISYSKNGGSYTAYSGAVAVAKGDIIKAYANATGYVQSPVTTFDNTYDPPQGGGGGGGGGGPPRLEL